MEGEERRAATHSDGAHSGVGRRWQLDQGVERMIVAIEMTRVGGLDRARVCKSLVLLTAIVCITIIK